MCRVISSAWCWARKSAPPSARRNFKFCAETQRRMTTIATTKDAMAQAKTRMEKAVEDFRKELAALRTEERRKDLVKHLHKVLENHRTAVRNIRRDIKEAVEKLEKEKKISEDERKRFLDELDKLTHQETKKLEDLSAAKEKEVLELK